MARVRAVHLSILAAAAATFVATAGCYTTLRNPNQPDPTAADVEYVDPDGVYVYPHVPSATVLGWYDYYGPYQHYYVNPWWYGHYYTGSSGDSPTPGTRVEGFGRGGRDQGAGVSGAPPAAIDAQAPTGHSSTSASTPRSETDTKPEPKPKEKKESEVGGRGGRQ